VFEEDIVFVTAADSDLEFASDDDIFFEDELCVPFNTHLFPNHDNGTIQDVFQASTLPDVLHGSESSFQLVAGALLPDCFHQVLKLILDEECMKHLDQFQFHLPVLYKVMVSLLQDIH